MALRMGLHTFFYCCLYYCETSGGKIHGGLDLISIASYHSKTIWLRQLYFLTMDFLRGSIDLFLMIFELFFYFLSENMKPFHFNRYILGGNLTRQCKSHNNMLEF